MWQQSFHFQNNMESAMCSGWYWWFWSASHLQTEYQEPAMSVTVAASEKSPRQCRQVENAQALSSDALHSHLEPVLVPRACKLKAVQHSWMTASAVPTVSPRRPRQLKIY